MATYLILNFMVLALVLFVALRQGVRYSPKVLLLSVGVLLPLTLLFDNLIIMSHIVAYDDSLISGVLLWRAPIEDFMYSLVAILLMPLLWKVFSRD